MSIPVIIDTDIGTDVDDAFALAMAAKEPLLDLRAVTTVYGDVVLRARMATKLLNLLGREDVPVAAGTAHPLLDGKDSYWGGWEGKRFLTVADEERLFESRDAVQLMRDLLLTSPEKVTLVAIGPLTNIALLIRDHPEVRSNIQEVICMAGTLQLDDEEWNVQCDPAAAEIVFKSNLLLKLGTRHFVNQPRLTQADRERLTKIKDPVNAALVVLLDEFLSHKTRTYTPMYDPVTLSMAFTDRFLPTQPRFFRIESRGQVLHLVPAEPHENNAVQISVPVTVRSPAFMDYLMTLLCQPAEKDNYEHSARL